MTDCLRISKKRHSYDIYDSEVMQGAIDKLRMEMMAEDEEDKEERSPAR